nr:alpha-L-arabinofuranosidase C-terminal domain-containing protein [Parabacteroides goldsteinii]
MNIPFKVLNISIILAAMLSGCQPEMPVTSSIIIDLDGFSVPVNKNLYGVTIEEINHAIDGGVYAEMIQNRSFEDGVPPLNCPYDAKRNVLSTPNGWTIPFIRPDSTPGWRKISSNTSIWPDNKELINDKNKRSLLVSVAASSETGRGGVVATGYNGLSIREGEKYELSLYLKGGSMIPKKVRIFLGDSVAETPLSETFDVSPIYEWRKYKHTFTASESTNNAVLAITADTSIVFWMDMVSLFPQKTWKDRPNGLRPDLMEMISSLNPQFVRFPGGSFVEGYTAGTYPVWHETIGDISTRRNFWNIWAYGSTNGMGYHEYLQMCEDLEAEPLYVINSGVTSQSRRPRYEDITAMNKLVQDALDAIAYANQPADSTFGAMRARNGHPEPFDLKYIEIGSENYGQEYSKRFDLFKKAINEAYPEITVIKSSFISGKNRNEWTDYHFYSGEDFLIANHDRYETGQYLRRFPAVFIGEFSMGDVSLQGTLRAAIGEACFLLGVESSPEVVKHLAYAPVLGNVNYDFQRYPAISFSH